MDVRYDDLAQIQRSVDDTILPGYRVDVLGGRVVVSPPVLSFPHNRVVEAVGRALESRVPEGLAVSWASDGLWLNADEPASEYQIPDIVVFDRTAGARERLAGTDIEVAVEVVSPSNRRDADYEQLIADRAVRYGITWILTADPETTTLAWWQDGEKTLGPDWATDFTWASLV